jgi:hypothetical protein
MKTKQSDLSIYDQPFVLEDFIFATHITIRKVKLSKEGFTPLIFRYKSDASWQCLSYTSANGDERWTTYKTDFVENYLNNLPDDVILEELL